jgi:GH15 family glucan-1,4-alpha-glucosidase
VRSALEPPGRPARDYVPIADYAAIGDGRTAALVARDGSVDWLCLPDLDSPSVFAAILGADRGGRFALQPELPALARRRYLPDTNVLETTFTTAQGVVKVTDAMALPSLELGPTRELIRRVDGIAGRVSMRWRIMPAFDYGATPPRIERRGTTAVAIGGRDALAVRCPRPTRSRSSSRRASTSSSGSKPRSRTGGTGPGSAHTTARGATP